MASSKSLPLILASLALVQAIPFNGLNSQSFSQLVARQTAPDFTPTAANIGDFADPALINVDNTWYAYSTEYPRNITNPIVNIPIATSPDLISWTRTGQDALPTLPAWVNTTVVPYDPETADDIANNRTDPGVWAPDVAEWIPGRWTMLFAGFSNSQDNRAEHCIGVAAASSPSGPFTPLSDLPLICTTYEQGGAIDAAHFHDPNTDQYWVVYKVDSGSINAGTAGSICGNNAEGFTPTPLMLQRINNPDQFITVDEPITLLTNEGVSDEGDIEAPVILYIPPQPSAPSAVQKRQDGTVYETVKTTICPEEQAASSAAAAAASGYQSALAYPTGTVAPPPGGSAVPPPPPPGGSAVPPPPGGSAVPPPSPSGSAPVSSGPSATGPSTTVPSDSSSSETSSSISAPAPSETTTPGGTYVLVFSPGCYADTSYAISYATADSVTGPYNRVAQRLAVSGTAGLTSPGGLTAVGPDPAERIAVWDGDRATASIVYHAGMAYPNGTRELYTGTLVWDGTALSIEGVGA